MNTPGYLSSGAFKRFRSKRDVLLYKWPEILRIVVISQLQEQGKNLKDFDIEAWRASHPIITQEELIANFLSIDIAAVPDALLPGYPLCRTGYNNLLVNYLQREKYDTSTRDHLRAWYQWRRQVQV